MRFNLKRWSMVVPVVIALLFSVNTAVAATSTNAILNHSLEIYEPFFWSAGSAGGTLEWAHDEAHGGTRSLKVTKTTTGTAASWKSGDHAQTYWNHMGVSDAGEELLYSASGWVKLDGVNIDPASDAGKIGLKWTFTDASDVLFQTEYVYVDQSAATADWVEFSESMLLTAVPAHAYCEALMGSDATGTVWFDDFSIGSGDNWSAGFFGGNCETPAGWMEWHASDAGVPLSTCLLTAAGAHTGIYSLILGDLDDGDDEAVYYSIPVAATPDTDYLVGVWAKMTRNNSDSSAYHPSGPMTTKLEDRVNLCFFFHTVDLEEAWELTGGDQFINFDQTLATADLVDEWRFYWAIVTAPSDAVGFSMRARLNNYFEGTCYFDDFVFEELTVGANLLANGDLETTTPFFHNEGSTGGTLTWATDEAHGGSRSLKIEKSATGAEASWVSDDHAQTYWNHMGVSDAGEELLYSAGAWVKLDGVNIDPASDAGKIGLKWTFTDASDVLFQTEYVYVDQSAATAAWVEFSESMLLTAVPAHAYCEALMGSDATGTVWFDDFSIGSGDNWSAGYFGGNCETPAGWMEWHDLGAVPVATSEIAEVAEADAHSGTHVAKLEDFDGTDEIVVYSIPCAVTADTWYEFSVFVKVVSVDTAYTNAAWYNSSALTTKYDDRYSLCFFFHAIDLEEAWELTGGDQFTYFDQYATIETPEWVEYRVISKAPSDAVGASLRARFNNDVVAEVWFDDFAISEVTVEELGVLDDIFARRAIPTTITLRQNYPNPFNSTTLITYSLPEAGQVQLQVFDLLGRRIATLFSGVQMSGGHSVTFNGISENGLQLGSGVYFYRLSTPTQSVVRKMLYIK